MDGWMDVYSIVPEPIMQKLRIAKHILPSVQFSHSVVSDSQPHGLQHARLPCPSPTPGVAQTHVHWVSDAIQPSHPLSSPSPPAFNLSQHQGLFQWVSSLHQVAKLLELQLWHQSFQCIFRTDFLQDRLSELRYLLLQYSILYNIFKIIKYSKGWFIDLQYL